MALPSNPMPSEKAPSSSAGATATDFSVPRTSVNHSRTKRMSRSSMVRSTNSCCLSMAAILGGRSRGSSRTRPPPAATPQICAYSSRATQEALQLPAYVRGSPGGSESAGEDGHGGRAARDAADPAAPASPGSAQQDARVLGLDTPPADVLGVLGPGPAQVAVEDVAARQPDVRLEVERCPRLQAPLAGRAAQQAVHERLCNDAVQRS